MLQLIKVDVWRSLKKVHYELNGTRFYKHIVSLSDPVSMEDAWTMTECPVTTFTVTTAGLAWTRWPSVPGDYCLTDEKDHNDRAVRRNSNGYRLYSRGDGTWAIGYDVTGKVMMSDTVAECPALCKQWQHSLMSIVGPWVYGGDNDVAVS